MNKQKNGLLETPGDVALRSATQTVNGLYNSTTMAKDIVEKEPELSNGNPVRSGLELLSSKSNMLVKKVSNVIKEMIFNSDELPEVNYSDYISEKLHHDYTYLSNVFSKITGTSIQQFIIINRIERVKKLLLHDELNLTEISYKLHYSSVAHLSNQFKKITGITPTYYMQMKQTERTCLENLGYL